jgi:ABC-type polysaccharide/polyol phosphate export permease
MSDKSKTDLLLFAFASAEAEYKDLSETWKLLDTKSQATTAIAGIFLAAVFNFVRPPATQWTHCVRLLLGLIVVALVVSILLALLAMRVRSVPSLPASEQAAAMVTARL